MSAGSMRRSGLEGLSFDDLMKLSEHEVFERVLEFSPCAACGREKSVKPSSIEASKESTAQVKKLTASVKCSSCGKCFRLTVTVPQTPEAYDAIYKMGMFRQALVGQTPSGPTILRGKA